MGQFCCRTERSHNHSPEERQGDVKTESIVRFFMAGMGSAGKSTIIRQLQNLCSKNPNYKLCNDEWRETKLPDIDKHVWQATIRRNILDSIDIFTKQIKQRQEEYEDEKNKEFAEKIEDICDEDAAYNDFDVDDTFRQSLLRLFADKAIKKMLAMRNKMDLPHKKLFDGAQYFLTAEKIAEIFDDNYDPSTDDKIHSRKPTTNMNKYRFILNETKIEIYDVGGQKSELLRITDYLRKWSLDGKETDRNFILLVAAMSDYNVRHSQYKEHTLLDESVEYTKLLLNNTIAENCGLLIFLNKKDRFEEKLDDEQCREDIMFLKEYLSSKDFKQYKENGKYQLAAMCDAVTAKFVDHFKTKYPTKSCYCRHTCAIDSKLMESIFAAVQNEVLSAQYYEIFP